MTFLISTLGDGAGRLSFVVDFFLTLGANLLVPLELTVALLLRGVDVAVAFAENEINGSSDASRPRRSTEFSSRGSTVHSDSASSRTVTLQSEGDGDLVGDGGAVKLRCDGDLLVGEGDGGAGKLSCDGDLSVGEGDGTVKVLCDGDLSVGEGDG